MTTGRSGAKKNNGPEKNRVLTLSDPRMSGSDDLEIVSMDFMNVMKEHPEIPVVLDLAGINKIFSKGIAVILKIYKECTAQNRPFSVHVYNDDLFSLFTLFKLDKAIAIKKVST